MSGVVPPSGDGMLVDFYDVKQQIDAWDHRHLNDEVDFVPTAELLAAEMQRRLLAVVRERVPVAHHDTVGVRVRLWETTGCYAQVGSIVASGVGSDDVPELIADPVVSG